MTDYPLDMQLVVDPLNPENVVRDGAVYLYDPSDEEGVSPIVLKDPSGLPLPNPLISNAFGFISPSIVTIPKVKWKSGEFEGFFFSYDGLRNEAIAARAAAESAALSANTAATDAAAVTEAALAGAVADAEAAAASAASAAALVGAPADTAVQTLINASGSATRSALDATIATETAAPIAAAVAPKLDSATAATTYALKSEAGPIAELATIGDSITAGGQGGGIYWAQLVSDYLGLSVWNPSVPGESPADIATRQGGLSPALTLTGDLIPATVTPVVVTTISPSAGWRTGAGAGFEKIGNFTGRLCGIPGTLIHSQIDGVWTFTRTTAGTATAAPAGSKFYTQDGKHNRAAIQTLWGGRNDPATSRVLANTASMVEYLHDPKRFLVFGILTSASEYSGTSGYNTVTAANNALATAYPDNYFDMRRYLIDYGLDQLGLTPTAQDLADIAGDTVPLTLRADSVHPNALGQQVIARKVARLLIAKEWVDDAGVVIPGFDDTPPPPTGPTVVEMATTSSTAQITSPEDLKTAQTLSTRVVGNYDSLVSKTIMGRYNTTGDQRSWQVLTLSGGKLRLQLFTAGTATPVTTLDSTVAATTTPGALLGLRVDFNAATGWVDFYTSTDGTTWVQLGTRVTFTALTVFAGTAPFTIMGGTGKIRNISVTSQDGVTPYIVEDFTDGEAIGWSYLNGAALVEE